MRISRILGERIWKGFTKVPFTIVIVNDETEYLLYHPRPSDDFVYKGFDPFLRTKVFSRKRVFRRNVLSVRSINGVPTIVAGTPANLKMISTKWIVKVLHEHFHQYQQFSKNFGKTVAELNIEEMEKKFRFDDPEINVRCQRYTAALADTIRGVGTKNFQFTLKNYRRQRSSLLNALTANEYKYFWFMVWMEGIAQYTEYKFLDLLKKYRPTNELRKLSDYSSFSTGLEKMIQIEEIGLRTSELREEKLVLLYSIGYAEGRILDITRRRWRQNYLRIQPLF